MDSFLSCQTFDLDEQEHERRASTSSVATDDSGYSSIFRTVNSVRVYSSKDEYLVAMIEDLAIWIHNNHFVEINIENFFDCLENGVILCKQAQRVQCAGEQFVNSKNNGNHRLPGKWSNCCLNLPKLCPKFQIRQVYQAFVCRDNVANFIGWMRSFGFSDSIMFETEDLISRKNIRHVVLALLELARVGGLFGLNVPNLIEMEQEIDAEILSDLETQKEEQSVDINLDETDSKMTRKGTLACNTKLDNDFSSVTFVKHIITPKPYFPECDIRSLDEMVRDVLLECQCVNQFPMTRLSEGKYLFGEKDLLIFVRILRSHVMVRVGGGWDTLNHLLFKHDPCRRDRPDETHHVNIAIQRDSTVSTSGFKNSKSIKRQSKDYVISKKSRDTKSSEIEEISARFSDIPTSFEKGKKSCGKITRRSSLQQPRRTDLSLTGRSSGSKIPILSRNLKAIKELPVTRRSSELIEINDTSSAPCSRFQSPILVRRVVPWK